MPESEILSAVQEGRLSAQEAYEKLYPPAEMHPPSKLKRARYLRLRMYLPEESKALNTFLRILFMFPLPVGLIGFATRFIKIPEKVDDEISLEELRQLLRYARGTKVNIISDDAIISIRID